MSIVSFSKQIFPRSILLLRFPLIYFAFWHILLWNMWLTKDLRDFKSSLKAWQLLPTWQLLEPFSSSLPVVQSLFEKTSSDVVRFHACSDSYLNYSKPSSCAGSHGLRLVGLVWNYSRANYASYPSRYPADPKERQFYENYDRGSSHPSVMNQIWLAWLPVLNAPAYLQ